MANINDLPDEIIEFILTYLPPYKDLEECKVVNKRWNCIVKDLVRRSKINIRKGLCDFRLSWQTWKQSNANAHPIIAGRFSHSSVLYDSNMYIFGGGSSCETTFNDLWRFDLSKMEWNRPLSKGTYPSPKGSATMVYYRDNLILFGGWRYPSLHPPYQQWCLFDELHYYHLKTNRWINHTVMSRPPPMAGHSATVHQQKMIVFGGYQLNGDLNHNSNDTWSFDLENFIWSLPNITETPKPQPRYGQYQTELDDNNLLIFGGCGGPNRIFSDAWILNMSKEPWQWKNIPVRNQKWSPSHLWCSPTCKVGNKLVVFGPTPNLPSNFQIIKQSRHNRQPENIPFINAAQNAAPREINNLNNNVNNAPNNQINLNLQNQEDGRNSHLNEAANRLQKNLALKYREKDPKLPKRFDEVYEDRLRMAAFNNQQQNLLGTFSKDHQERIRRLEEKMNTIRNTRRAEIEKKSDEPSPKRSKRNVVSMFVCDISKAQCPNDPHLQWIEYKNFGIISGAPERLILSSVVWGNGELILFGGVHKETLTELTHEVSNSVHFLTAPKDVI